MISEFDRFRMPGFRKITGILQILAGLGLTVGLFSPFLFPWITSTSTSGLALQMLVGIGVRIRIKDKWFQILPALFFLILNLFIFYRYLKIDI